MRHERVTNRTDGELRGRARLEERLSPRGARTAQLHAAAEEWRPIRLSRQFMPGDRVVGHLEGYGRSRFALRAVGGFSARPRSVRDAGRRQHLTQDGEPETALIASVAAAC
jgi:hypothetical protein